VDTIVHACLLSDCGKHKIGLQSRLAWAKASPYLQNNQSKSAEGVAQAVEHLPNKHEVLS
jgi:hypothetical protein